ncbi:MULTISPECIES: amphi-Trp domain-containing protein [unclassified Luteococcus]|uniref:amphi-Trp domain-containing protein n=1 Tax=unclassified Luteococcus TaxID=2639923 RepID=UPI00313E2677
MGDELYENETEQTMTREEAAARLREIADDLSRHNQLRVSHGDREVVVPVPKRVTLEVELEAGEESELEITISW